MKRTMTHVLVSGLLIAIAGCPTTTGDGVADGDTGGDGGNGGSQARLFTATLSSDQETEFTGSTATGTATLTLNAEETEVAFEITASGLSSPLTGAHFHNAPAGQDGGIVFPFTNIVMLGTDGSVTANGTWPIGAADLAELRAGNIYINIHTLDHPPGEIRGQLLAAE